ncbi:MAG: hypothetical protein LBS43_11545 [Prevotellaceae bacterium]|jgi:hypothetical protein|nr:hypothetical protein [Prevotellaceae bacterium]
MNGKIIATKLHKIENCILGAQNNPEIQEKLSAFGYTPERIGEGKTLLNKVNSLMTAQVEEYSDQFIATDKVGKLWKTAYSNYMIIVKLLRVIFVGQPEMLKRFNATGRRNRSLSGWLRDARILYENLLNSPDALTVIAQFGYSAEKLNDELQAVNEVENLHSKRLSEKGEAQQSTIERDKAFDELCQWFSKFRAIARIAIYDKPQLLEALGIVKS